jgi:hypothetical protein
MCLEAVYLVDAFALIDRPRLVATFLDQNTHQKLMSLGTMHQ